MPAKHQKSELRGLGRDYGDWLSERLTDPQKAADYINAAIEDGSPGMLLLAMRDVAEAHKMSKVAKGAGVAREAIYRILSKKGNPRLRSFRPVLLTMGLDFFVRPRIAHGEGKSLRRSVAKRKSQASTAEQLQMSFRFEDATRKQFVAQEAIETWWVHPDILFRSSLDDTPEVPAFTIPSTNEVDYVQA